MGGFENHCLGLSDFIIISRILLDHKGGQIVSQDLEFIDGIVFSIQEIILFYDELTIGKHLVRTSGYKLSDFLKAQKRTGFKTRKMNKFFREIFEGSEL